MNNNEQIKNEDENEESNLSSEKINENNIFLDNENNNEENEKEIDINNQSQLNSSSNSILSLEKLSNNSSSEIVSLKQFKNLLGVLGQKSTNFIIERLYQILVKINSKKYEHIKGNLITKDFLNYLSMINSSEINHEIFYLFFDISNKGYITKNNFINVISNICETICEFTQKNPNIYKEDIINLYDQLLQINMKSMGGGDNSQQWISKTSFMKLIESGKINFYDLMNSKSYGNNIGISQNQYGSFKDIMNSIKTMRKKIIQKENVESNLSIITNNYLDNIKIFKDEYYEYKKMQEENDFKNNNNNKNLNSINNKYNNINTKKKSKFLPNNNTIKNEQTKNQKDKINKNENSSSKSIGSFISSPKIKINSKFASPQQRLLKDKGSNNNTDDNELDLSIGSFDFEEEEKEKDEELNNKILKEENEDSVPEMDNKSIKDVQNIKKKRTQTSNQVNLKENSLSKNQNNNFFFLKPFKLEKENELQKELIHNNIDINNTLILLKKDNFLNYLETLEKNLYNEINNINELNNISNMIRETRTSIILNKPLKEKEIYEIEKSFENTLNNTNMEIMIAIILGIEKCIISLGDFELNDKNMINELLANDDSFKTTRKKRNTIFLAKFDKIEKKNSQVYEAISNYPFKKHKYIFNEVSTFNYTFYSNDKKDESIVNLNKIEISEYAPKIFCNIRYNFGEITNKDFLYSFNIESFISNIILGNISNLNQLLTINKDNFPEFIMFSADTKYVIKCITQNEFDVLQKILPNYYEYLVNSIIKTLQKNNLDCPRSRTFSSTFSSSGFNQFNNNLESKCTLLDIIYGIFSVNIFDKKLFFIIKKNIFYSYNNLSVSKKYDLKGSSVDRTSKKVSDVYKDLDYLEFEEKLDLSTKNSNYLSEILEKDTLFLSENNIINYSFYIGIAKISESFENEESEEGILSSDKNKMYYFGISDIFTEYGAGKKMEYIFKRITKGNGISSVPPIEYKTRFDNFIKLCLK